MTVDPNTPAVTKKPWESKTVWTNVILTVAGLAFPSVRDAISSHPEVLTIVFGGVNLILRFISHGKIALKE